ncbi:vascular endothelial growth factor receptor 1-like [Leptonychotes weddellii]|uniref:Vascular endothelial growth factor receptor 1-like n=1 Tax=Leptonychotes weddellii TaxID=9713 RepID=A0A7F8PYI5_LEPWE|nr:vascular endothelial growth factor receptor 1-like [Leptonychotes weddellii]
MVSCWDTGVLLCALLGGLLLTGSSSGSKLKGPELSLKGTQHVMQAGQTLYLKCRGEAAHSWSLPETVRKESKRLSITKSACGRNGKQFCSTLTLNAAQANHTGFYSCKYLSIPASKKKKTESTIYIFINEKLAKFDTVLKVAYSATFHTLSSDQSENFCVEETKKRASIRQRIGQHTSIAIVFYSVLVIDKVQNKDKGLYTCHVKSGPSFKSVNTSVHVYDKAFITVKHRKQHVLETTAGKRAYRLSVKVKAFPSPEVLWLKDGFPVTEKSPRYLVHGYSLIIKDVAAEDAGDYTILLAIKQSSVFKNLTTILIVNVKPQIYEKAVSSFPDPTLYPLGSRQTLTCTIYGLPQPTVTWFWRACNHSHSKASEVLYSYFIDVPNGFHVNLEKMPTEGEDLKLSCTVNKFLYRDITWILLRTVKNRTMHHSISKQKMAITKEYSVTLNVTIKNVSLEDSGTYACRARNIYTGEEILQKKEVTIRDQEAPHLLRNLSDHTVAISSSTTLDCHATGVPEPQITWFKNHHKIQQEPGSPSVGHSHSREEMQFQESIMKAE